MLAPYWFRPCSSMTTYLKLYLDKMGKGFLETRYKAFLWCLGTFTLIGLCQDAVQLIYNTGGSLPQSYFLQLKYLPARVGHYTQIWHKTVGVYVVKKIIGQAGDKLWYDDKKFLWLNKTQVGKLYSHRKDGSPLTPISPGVIPKGYVFLYASHERSFDSRYQEFGLIPQKALQGRLIPLGGVALP